MTSKNTRHILRKKNILAGEAMHVRGREWRETDWFVPYLGDHALIHHNHSPGEQEHCLCGPLAFCCQRSADLFGQNYPKSALARSHWTATDARQIVSWMDAGVQIVYFVYCLSHAQDDLAVSVLSGDDARQVLYRHRSLDALSAENSSHASARLLSEIAVDGDQGMFPWSSQCD